MGNRLFFLLLFVTLQIEKELSYGKSGLMYAKEWANSGR